MKLGLTFLTTRTPTAGTPGRWRQALCSGLGVALCLGPLLAQAQATGQKSSRVVVQALNQAMLSAEIAARITQMPFREGDSFAAGDVLVRFDCGIFTAQQDKVAAEFQAAVVKFENDRELEKSRSIGALEVKLSEVAVQRAKAELRMAEINTQRCTIVAPWNGRVTQRKANELEMAKLHQEILGIVATDSMEVMAVVPGQWVRSLRDGQTFEVRIDETGTRHTAEIVAIGSQVDAVSQTLNLRGRIAADKRLLPGMTGTAFFR